MNESFALYVFQPLIGKSTRPTKVYSESVSWSYCGASRGMNNLAVARRARRWAMQQIPGVSEVLCDARKEGWPIGHERAFGFAQRFRTTPRCGRCRRRLERFCGRKPSRFGSCGTETGTG